MYDQLSVFLGFSVGLMVGVWLGIKLFGNHANGWRRDD